MLSSSLLPNVTADRPTSSKIAFDHEPVIFVHAAICAQKQAGL